MEEIKTKKMHTLKLDNQKHLEICGIVQVESFSDSGVLIRMESGTLIVNGENLLVNKFDVEEGRVVVDGLVTGIRYAGTPEDKRGGFFKKLFS